MWQPLIVLVLLLSFNTSANIAKQQYPEEWWEAIPEEQGKSWEILPQAAKPDLGKEPTEVVLSKRNELGILSNFAHTPFTFKGIKYESLEGFWQMMKYPEDDTDPRMIAKDLNWKFTRQEVSQMVGFDAKDAGSLASENMKKMGINWITFEGRKITYKTSKKGDHYDIIRAATVEKVNQNPKVKRILLATEGLKLLADHRQGADTPPAWKYYEILMEIRTELARKNP